MKKMMVTGIFSLITAAICVSALLMHYQKNWIMLPGGILFSILYVKCIRNTECIAMIKEHFSKRNLLITGFVLILIAVSFLPDFTGGVSSGSVQFVMYVLSFICWMLGMFILDIRF